VKVPSVDLSSLPELKEFFPMLCLLARFLDALLAEYPLLFHRTLNNFVLLYPVPLCTFSMPNWQSFSESSVILSPELTIEFFSNATRAYAQCPLAEIYRTPYRFCLLNSQLIPFLCALPFTCSMSSWKSFTELTAKFYLQLCFQLHSLAS
jgi:hypothetical protein